MKLSNLIRLSNYLISPLSWIAALSLFHFGYWKKQDLLLDKKKWFLLYWLLISILLIQGQSEFIIFFTHLIYKNHQVDHLTNEIWRCYQSEFGTVMTQIKIHQWNKGFSDYHFLLFVADEMGFRSSSDDDQLHVPIIEPLGIRQVKSKLLM